MVEFDQTPNFKMVWEYLKNLLDHLLFIFMDQVQ
jgi:hypothetical protein